MLKKNGALTIAEGSPAYKTDADIIFNNGRDKKEFVLRTCYDDIGVWKSKHGVSISGFKDKSVSPQKWAAKIDKDYWIFGIDAQKPEDIVAAVKIGMRCYGVKASDLISDIYVKNLNIENEHQIGRDVIVKANKKLYEGACKAIVQAAKLLGVQGILNFHVFSNNKNFKIPMNSLHEAMMDGGAETVESDETPHKFNVGSNDGRRVFENLISHLHLAKFRV